MSNNKIEIETSVVNEIIELCKIIKTIDINESDCENCIKLKKYNEENYTKKSRYSLFIITYNDDYKQRYDSGVYPEDILYFDNYQDAIIFVEKRIESDFEDYICSCFDNYKNNEIDKFEEYLIKNCYDDKEDHNDFLTYFNYIKDIEEKTNEYDDIVETISDIINKGEFIDTKFSYEINEVKQ